MTKENIESRRIELIALCKHVLEEYDIVQEKCKNPEIKQTSVMMNMINASMRKQKENVMFVMNALTEKPTDATGIALSETWIEIAQECISEVIEAIEVKKE